MKFVKDMNYSGLYIVKSHDKNIGSVQRNDNWTVRGTHVNWMALKRGQCVATGFSTRKEAAEHLLKLKEAGL